MSQRPKLFLDVDDVINVTHPDRRGAGTVDWKQRKVLVGSGGLYTKYRIVWSPTVADRLASLPADKLWATSWGHLANRHIAPLLGWSPLPVAAGPLDEHDTSWTSNDPRKSAAVIAHADAPFVWVDDSAITDAARCAIASTVDVPYLLVTPDERFGLTAEDLDTISEFVAAHQPS